jgi:hypothetical protein
MMVFFKELNQHSDVPEMYLVRLAALKGCPVRVYEAWPAVILINLNGSFEHDLPYQNQQKSRLKWT